MIQRSVKGHDDAANRPPFKYSDKGSMATVSRFSAVVQVGKLEFGGFIAWLAWLVLHLYYLIGFQNRFTTLLHWAVTFLGRRRSQMTITSQMTYARLAMTRVEARTWETLAAVEQAEQVEEQSSTGQAAGVTRRKQQTAG